MLSGHKFWRVPKHVKNKRKIRSTEETGISLKEMRSFLVKLVMIKRKDGRAADGVNEGIWMHKKSHFTAASGN